MSPHMVKYIFIAFISLSTIASAKSFEKPHCVDVQSLPFDIVKKLDDHHYEMVPPSTPSPMHIILETKKAIFTTTGHPVGIGVIVSEDRIVTMQNGFKSRVGVLTECAIIPYKEKNRANPSLSFRKEINGQ